MNVLGQVTVGTNIEYAEKVDASWHFPSKHTDNITGEESAAPISAKPAGTIRFTGKRGQKIDLYRVIIALYECGFFTDASGAKPTQKQVFEAFSQMLGADFSDFQKNLSESKSFNNDSEAPTRIFDNLKEAIKQYYGI